MIREANEQEAHNQMPSFQESTKPRRTTFVDRWKITLPTLMNTEICKRETTSMEILCTMQISLAEGE